MEQRLLNAINKKVDRQTVETMLEQNTIEMYNTIKLKANAADVNTLQQQKADIYYVNKAIESRLNQFAFEHEKPTAREIEKIKTALVSMVSELDKKKADKDEITSYLDSKLSTIEVRKSDDLFVYIDRTL